jgi:hypothetical protein
MNVGRTTLFEWFRGADTPADLGAQLVVAIRREQDARYDIEKQLNTIAIELGGRYLQLRETLMRERRPLSSEIAVEMGRPQSTIDAKISECGLTSARFDLRPLVDYSEPQAIRKQRHCMDCRRSFFSESAGGMCGRCRVGPMAEVIGVFA